MFASGQAHTDRGHVWSAVNMGNSSMIYPVYTRGFHGTKVKSASDVGSLPPTSILLPEGVRVLGRIMDPLTLGKPWSRVCSYHPHGHRPGRFVNAENKEKAQPLTKLVEP